jgi:hypothetical protein
LRAMYRIVASRSLVNGRPRLASPFDAISTFPHDRERHGYRSAIGTVNILEVRVSRKTGRISFPINGIQLFAGVDFGFVSGVALAAVTKKVFRLTEMSGTGNAPHAAIVRFLSSRRADRPRSVSGESNAACIRRYRACNGKINRETPRRFWRQNISDNFQNTDVGVPHERPIHCRYCQRTCLGSAASRANART